MKTVIFALLIVFSGSSVAVEINALTESSNLNRGGGHIPPVKKEQISRGGGHIPPVKKDEK